MSTNVPRTAQIQLEKAEELRRQMYGEDTPPEGTLIEDGSNNLEQQIPENNPATTPDPAESADPAPSDDGHVAPIEESLEEKYRKLEAAHLTLQGKYRAEVPRHLDTIKDLRQQLDAAKKGQQEAERAARQAEVDLSAATSRLTEEVGEDAGKAISDLANSIVDEKINQRMDKLNQDEQSAENPEDAFWNTIYGKVPDFYAVNNSPEFDGWLRGTDDPTTGLTYKDSINEAGRELNALRVVEIVQQFQRREIAPPPPPKSEQEQHVSPPKTPAPPKEPELPQYTAADYTKLQEQVRKGMWKGREAEAEALERKIHAALTGL